ncbi:hypothetical protein [Rhizobium laguerreae]|uniref:hypothetical protein n=1 Tax=Rhizobium laguerreae TaxID=1076926 RepID=UPI001C8FDD42|nr:hypothetical protein [Rhizobium laguerreae]MBY3136533.1 hypothetical protein [Rhizobium laguerreae]
MHLLSREIGLNRNRAVKSICMNWALSCLLPTVTEPLFVLPIPDLFLRLSPPSMSGSDRLPLELMVIIALLEKKGEFEGFFTNAANELWGDDFEPWKP